MGERNASRRMTKKKSCYPRRHDCGDKKVKVKTHHNDKKKIQRRNIKKTKVKKNGKCIKNKTKKSCKNYSNSCNPSCETYSRSNCYPNRNCCESYSDYCPRSSLCRSCSGSYSNCGNVNYDCPRSNMCYGDSVSMCSAAMYIPVTQAMFNGPWQGFLLDVNAKVPSLCPEGRRRPRCCKRR